MTSTSWAAVNTSYCTERCAPPMTSWSECSTLTVSSSVRLWAVRVIAARRPAPARADPADRRGGGDPDQQWGGGGIAGSMFELGALDGAGGGDRVMGHPELRGEAEPRGGV